MPPRKTPAQASRPKSQHGLSDFDAMWLDAFDPHDDESLPDPADFYIEEAGDDDLSDAA